MSSPNQNSGWCSLCVQWCFQASSNSKESSLLTDDRFDATTLRGNGHGALIDTEVEEFQGFFIDEDHGEVTELLKKHNLLRD